MKFKNFTVFHLFFLLLLNFTFSRSIKYNNSKSKYNKETKVIEIPNNNTLTYNFYCLKDYKISCDISLYNLNNAVSLLLKSFKTFPTIEFDVIVDDFSKLKSKTKFNDVYITLNKDYQPLNESLKESIKVYPNYKALNEKIYTKINKEGKQPDFIVVLDNFKNNKEFLSKMNFEHQMMIIKGIIDGLTIPEKPMLQALVEKTMNDAYAGLANENSYFNNTLLFKNENSLKKKDRKYNRIVAVGDIHGDYNQFIKILKHAKLIDKNKNWIGKNSILVQMGDLVDRGVDSKKVLDLMIKLKKQSKQNGHGKVYSILGNHELNRLSGIFTFSLINDMMSFGSIEQHRKAFALHTKYGNFLRKEMEPVVIVDDILFTHAGLISEYADLGISQLNKKIHDILIDAPYNITSESTHPLLTDPMIINNGPMWTRFFSLKEENQDVCEELSKVLKTTKTTRMVIGHDVQKNGKINSLCDNQLIMIDIGLTKQYGQHFGYLEIKRDKNEFWEIYN